MATIVRSFEHLGEDYFHVLFCDEDDRIELHDGDGNTILEYDASCNVRDEHGKVGDFRLENGLWVSYARPNMDRTVHPCRGVEALLDAEVEFSKRYLTRRANTRVAVTESEGGEID